MPLQKHCRSSEHSARLAGLSLNLSRPLALKYPQPEATLFCCVAPTARCPLPESNATSTKFESDPHSACDAICSQPAAAHVPLETREYC